MRVKMEYGLDTLVRLLYIEPAVRDRRILVVGPEGGPMEEVLGRMGAQLVRTWTPGTSRALPWDLASLRGKRDAGGGAPVRPGEVDLVFVPDLGEIDDYRGVLAEAARLLARDGLMVVSVRNAECTVPVSETGLEERAEVWSLESLEQLLDQFFDWVEMVGQSPFLGYALASWEAARGREGVRLDTSLMNREGEDPEFILALCAPEPPSSPLTNALFQIPIVEMALVEGQAPEPARDEGRTERSLHAELEMLRREIGNKNVMISRLEAEIEKLESDAEQERQRMFDLRQQMQKERKGQQKEALETMMRKEVDKTPETWLSERATLTREKEELQKSLVRAESRMQELEALRDEEGPGVREAEARAERHEKRARDLQKRMERAESRAKELRVQLKQAEARLREEETRAPRMGRRIEELEGDLEKRDRDLEKRDRDLEERQRALESCRETREGLERELAATQDRQRLIEKKAERARDRAMEAEKRVAELEAAAEEMAGAPRETGRVAELEAELGRREELVRDLIRELEVLPTIMEEDRGALEEPSAVGEVERERGANVELARRAEGLEAELERARARTAELERELTEAAALVEIVGDALGDAPASPAAGSAPQASIDRVLVDVQEAIRRVAGSTPSGDVARELGKLWVEIGQMRARVRPDRR